MEPKGVMGNKKVAMKELRDAMGELGGIMGNQEEDLAELRGTTIGKETEAKEPRKGSWASQGPSGEEATQGGNPAGNNTGGKARNKIQKDFGPNGEEHELTTHPGGERGENTTHWGEEENI